MLKEIHFPHSLGLLYSAFTYYCGFKVNSGEYKLMGLAPYGKPIYADKIKEKLIDYKYQLFLINKLIVLLIRIQKTLIHCILYVY